MKQFIHTYWKTLAFFTIVGLIGGFFTGLYLLDSYPPEIQQQIAGQGLSRPALGLITAVQSAGYGLVLGACGIWLGKKTGLWREEHTITGQPLRAAIVAAVAAGMGIILPDLLFFGRYSEPILQTYAVKPTVPYLLASIFYGGVIEEVMMRLFFLSLVAFVLHKLFGKGSAQPSTCILIAANVLAALLFAAGHLPTTFILLGNSPMILFRCFLLNGGFGLLFGYLYCRYGLRYAMIAHGGAHIVSKLIWILFV